MLIELSISVAPVVNAVENKYLDSSALGMLLILLQHNGEEPRIKLINCRSAVKEILKITKFDGMFDVP